MLLRPLAALALVASAAHAECPLPAKASPALADLPDGRRRELLDDAFTGAARGARIWSWGWGLTLAAGGAATLAVAPFVDRADWRTRLYVSGTRTLLGSLTFPLLPLATMREARAHRARAARGGDPCELLAEDEAGLARAARSERRGRGLLRHLSLLGVNAAAALFLGLAFEDWEGALILAGTGIAGGELIIWTQPTRAARALDRYRRGDTGARPVDVTVTPLLLGDGVGIGAVGTF